MLRLIVLIVVAIVALASAANIRRDARDPFFPHINGQPAVQDNQVEQCLAENAICSPIGGGNCCACMSCSCRAGAMAVSETCRCIKTPLDRLFNFFRSGC